MFTGKTGRQVVRTCILLFFCLAAVSKVFAEEVLVPESIADYGSGYTIGSGFFYAGGVPGTGLFLGQPNSQGRNDRALVRFTISPYLLSARPVGSAKLCFGIVALYLQLSEDAHEIEITHLTYNANSLSVNDMLNSHAETVEIVSVKKTKPTDAVNLSEYSIDVTKYVNADIEKGNMYSAFRFKDVTAETKNRGSATNTYGIILQTLFQLKLR